MWIRRALCLSLLTALTSCIGIADGDVDEPTAQGFSRLGAVTPETDLRRLAVAQVPAPDDIVLIPESSYLALLANLRSESQPESIRKAAEAAARGQDLWTAGVLGLTPVVRDGLVDADVFFVVRDGALDETRKVQTSNYFVAAVHLVGRVEWFSRGASFAIVPSSAGSSGRCCGASLSCINQRPVLPSDPHCGDQGLCIPPVGIEFAAPNAAGDDMHQRRQAAGKEPVTLSVHTGGPTPDIIDLSCWPPVNGGSCGVISPTCGLEPGTGIDQSGDDVSIPLSNGCASQQTRPVQGRKVPAVCEYAAGPGAVSAGGADARIYGSKSTPTIVSCDGYSDDNNPSMEVESNGQPKFCRLMKVEAGNPLCDANTKADTISMRAFVELECGPGSGGASSPSCCGENCRCIGVDGQPDLYGKSYASCVKCNGDGCKTFARPFGMSPWAASADLGGTSGGAAPSSDEEGPGSTPPGPAPDEKSTSGGNEGRKLVGSDGAYVLTLKDKTLDYDQMMADAIQAWQEKRADPVDVSSGSFLLTQHDLSLEGARPFTFTRHYASRGVSRSSLGSSWSHSWQWRILPLRKDNAPAWLDPWCAATPGRPNCVWLIGGDGTRRLYARDVATGLFLPQAGDMSTVLQLPEGGWARRSVDGHTMRFDADGYLVDDRDRFGNGFTLAYEPTDWGRLVSHYCLEDPYALDSNGKAKFRTASKRHDSAECRLLNALTGRATAAVPFQSTFVNASAFPAPSSSPLAESRDALLRLQGQWYGLEAVDGAEAKRVTRVTDDEGRSLVLSYISDTSANRGLLASVTGPAGMRVTYAYGRPATADGAMNAAFLVEIHRNDVATGGSVDATRSRRIQYTYAWNGQQAGAASALGEYGQRYLDFWSAYTNCGVNFIGTCGQTVATGFKREILEPKADHLRRLAQLSLFDNITKVTYVDGSGASAPVIESETRYETDWFAEDFDRVKAQRYGASGVGSAPATGGYAWETSLPFASFSYVQPSPGTSGSGNARSDATSAVLPPAIAQRYPLEGVSTQAEAKAESVGALLPPLASFTLPVPGKQPLLLEGAQLPASGAALPLPACEVSKLPHLATRLPGYRPSFGYFNSVERPQGGVPYDAPLLRSRVGCDELGSAQLGDVAANDLVSTLDKVPGTQVPDLYRPTRLLGNRKHWHSNANRICRWTRFVDREGVESWLGLGYQGTLLVEAKQLPDGRWRFDETIYTADARVASKRRPGFQGEAYSVERGDQRFIYSDVDPSAESGHNAKLPWFWARRGNVEQIIERPDRTNPATSPVDESEAATSPVGPAADRYQRFEYEPLFNQVSLAEQGTVSSSGLVPHRVSKTLFDYQELSLSELAPVLNEAQAWGAGLYTSNGLYDWSKIHAWQLRQNLSFGDVNGDGVLGTPQHGVASSRGRGLPVRVRTKGWGGTGPALEESTFFSWNSAGRLRSVKAASGASVRFEYFPVGTRSGAGPVAGTNRGPLAKRHVVRVWPSWPSGAGPARAPCPLLSGTWQWLLPASCSNPQAELLSLGLPAQVVADILATQPGGSEAEDSIRFGWDELGRQSEVVFENGAVISTRYDADGRPVRTVDALGFVSTTTYDFLGKPVSLEQRNGSTVTHQARWRHDEEGHLLQECVARSAGECPSAGSTGGVTRSWSYSREGRLSVEVDPEGDRTLYAYDALGRVKSIEQTDGPRPSRVKTLEWSPDGEVTKVTYGLGVTETLEYDGFGRPSLHTDGNGAQWRRRFTPRDTVASVTKVGGTPWNTQYASDALGRVVSKRVNGHEVQRLSRGPGGLVFAEQGEGFGASYSLRDAAGLAAFSEDAAGSQSLLVPSTGGRRSTSVRIRKGAGSVLVTSATQTFDLGSRPLSTMEQGGGLTRTTQYSYAANGHLEMVVGADGSWSSQTTNLLGWLTQSQVLASAQPNIVDTTVVTSNRRGESVTVVDPKGETSAYQRNAFGQVLVEAHAGAGGIRGEREYDVLGRVKATRNGVDALEFIYAGASMREAVSDRGTLLEREVDDLGRLTRSTRFNRSSTSIPTAHQTVITNLAYDDLGRLKSDRSTLVAVPAPLGVTSQYSSASGTWVRTLGRPGGVNTTEQFDSVGRLAAQTRPGGRSTSWSWLGELQSGVSTAKGAGAALTQTIGYDGLAQRTSSAHSAGDINGGAAIWRQTLKRDVMGRLVSVSHERNQPGLSPQRSDAFAGFWYDAMGRIETTWEATTLPTTLPPTHTATRAAVAQAANQVGAASFAYDREQHVGSLLSIGGGRYAAPARSTASRLNEVTVVGVRHVVQHDAAGRIRSENGTVFEWDPLDQLVAVRPNGGQAEGLLYDGLNRLVARYQGDSFVEAYAYDGHQMVGAYDAQGQALWQASWAPGTDKLHTFTDSRGELIALEDERGNLGGLFSVSKNAVDFEARYTAEGLSRSRDWSNGISCDEAVGQECRSAGGVPFGLHMAWRSPKTGLHYFRNRWYSSQLGQWLTRDPLGFVDSFDPYAFNGFDGVNFSDPFGLSRSGLAESNTGRHDNRRTPGKAAAGTSPDEPPAPNKPTAVPPAYKPRPPPGPGEEETRADGFIVRHRGPFDYGKDYDIVAACPTCHGQRSLPKNRHGRFATKSEIARALIYGGATFVVGGQLIIAYGLSAAGTAGVGAAGAGVVGSSGGAGSLLVSLVGGRALVGALAMAGAATSALGAVVAMVATGDEPGTDKTSGPTDGTSADPTFGRDLNQVHHAFRHTDKLGLSREDVMQAVRQDLVGQSKNIPDGLPLNRVVDVAGTRVQYSAFRLADGSVNVGRIHGVP